MRFEYTYLATVCEDCWDTRWSSDATRKPQWLVCQQWYQYGKLMSGDVELHDTVDSDGMDELIKDLIENYILVNSNIVIEPRESVSMEIGSSDGQ